MPKRLPRLRFQCCFNCGTEIQIIDIFMYFGEHLKLEYIFLIILYSYNYFQMDGKERTEIVSVENHKYVKMAKISQLVVLCRKKTFV